MKLRGQLMLVTSLVVVLPLLGLQFVAQVEKLLRQGLEQALTDSAQALATVVPAPEPAGGPGIDPVYVHDARQPLLLDGYGDDWAAWLDVTERLGPDGREQRFSVEPPGADSPVSLALAQSPVGLHLLLQVFDPDTRFAGDDGAPGDHVELRFSGSRGESRMLVVPAAPGRFTRAAEPAGWPTVHGVWQAVARGWNLELRIPLRDRPTGLGVTVFDVGGPGRPTREFAIAGRAPLVAPDPEISKRLRSLLPGGMRAWMVTHDGYVLGHADRASSAPLSGRSPSIWQALLFERLAGDSLSEAAPPGRYSARLTGPDLAAARAGGNSALWTIERASESPGARVRVALPLAGDTRQAPLLVLERDADALLLLASDAVLRLAGASLLVFIAAAAVLLAFAWRLSSRIRRLQRATEAAVADDGKVVSVPAHLRGGDEIAALSGSMASLLDRLRVHQQYLGTLADRLSHELRTPLTMIGSSLDNLAEQVEGREAFDAGQARLYLDRAGQGNRRLNRIFRAMSQAARLEEALIDEPFEVFDLAGLVADYCAARQPACPGHVLRVERPQQPVHVHGSPDLIAQLLDKLVDNALDFAPVGSDVRLRVRPTGSTVRLEVDNEGPRVDPASAAELFEPMVTMRGSSAQPDSAESCDDRPHLGLGLFIARLIAQRHGGRMLAEATETGSRFSLQLPRRRPDDRAGL